MLVHVRNYTTLNELVLKHCGETWMLKEWKGDAVRKVEKQQK
jgi:hypothetical protein